MRTGRHIYICRSRRMGSRCDLPMIPQEQLDEAVRESFVRQFVDAVDVSATIERDRQRLVALKQTEKRVAREEFEGVQADVAAVEALEERARPDYEAGSISADLYSKLHQDYEQRLAAGRVVLTNLEAAAAVSGGDLTTHELDMLLDRVIAIKRLIDGRLTASEIPYLNAQLHEVFSEFSITHEGRRIIVDPKLRPEFVPEGSWRTLDFGDEDQEGVEVVEHVGAVMRKVSLTSAFGEHKISGSS